LLIASQGDTEEACRLLRGFGSEAINRDQFIPHYDVFARAFIERFSCGRDATQQFVGRERNHVDS
jgi:hypothetical protein